MVSRNLAKTAFQTVPEDYSVPMRGNYQPDPCVTLLAALRIGPGMQKGSNSPELECFCPDALPITRH